MSTLGHLGEFGFIDKLREWAPGLDTSDDAAIVDVGGTNLALTTDALVEGIHFRRDWSSGHDIGFKAVSVNVSDLAASHARPRWLVLSIGAPSDTPVAFLEEVYDGFAGACERYGCELVGGDTVRSDELFMSLAAIGVVEGEPWRRSGAQVGDVVAVTARLGRAAAGVNLLMSQDPKKVDPDEALACMEAHRRPIARIDALGVVAHAAIDISDGLGSDAAHMAVASGHGIVIDELPIAPEVAHIAEARGWDAEAMVLAGGEDFELLFALDGSNIGDLIRVGRVVDDPGVWYKGKPLETRGYDHFKKR